MITELAKDIFILSIRFDIYFRLSLTRSFSRGPSDCERCELRD